MVATLGLVVLGGIKCVIALGTWGALLGWVLVADQPPQPHPEGPRCRIVIEHHTISAVAEFIELGEPGFIFVPQVSPAPQDGAR